MYVCVYVSFTWQLLQCIHHTHSSIEIILRVVGKTDLF